MLFWLDVGPGFPNGDFDGETLYVPSSNVVPKHALVLSPLSLLYEGGKKGNRT